MPQFGETFMPPKTPAAKPLTSKELAAFKIQKTPNLELTDRGLTDQDIEKLVVVLAANPCIKKLNVSNNCLTNTSATLLAQNNTLHELILQTGNKDIKGQWYLEFLKNDTLCKLSIRGGSGPELAKVRAKIKQNPTNRDKPSISAATVPSLKATSSNESQDVMQHSSGSIQTPTLPVKPIKSKRACSSYKVKPLALEKKHSHKVYIRKVVTQKTKTGEKSFSDLIARLCLDMPSFSNNMTMYLTYIAVVMQAFMHNASHEPATGYGKVQKREALRKLLYYRSQSDHPHMHLHYEQTKGDNTSKVHLLPRNKPLEKIIGLTDSTETLHTELSKLNELGFLKDPAKKLPPFFPQFLGYSGVRTNNLRVTQEAMEACDDVSSYLLKLSSPDVKSLTPDELTSGISRLKKAFIELSMNANHFPVNQQLFQAIDNERSCYARALVRLSAKEKFKYLEVSERSSSCVYIKIMNPTTWSLKGETIKNNIVLTLMGYFTGLINYHAKQKGLYIHTQRRQSFGFIRATTSDTEPWHIRLSLGLEPKIYLDCVMLALKELDTLLTNIDIVKLKTLFDRKNLKKSPKTQWALVHMAEYARENNESFAQYLDAIYAQSKRKSLKAQDALIVKQEKNVEARKIIFNNHVVFQVLNNIVNYTFGFVNKLMLDDVSSLKKRNNNSFYHHLLKLYKNADKAKYLLDHLERYEISHLYAKSHLLIENLLEYLILIDNLNAVQLSTQGKKSDPITKLAETDKNHAKQVLGLDDSQIDVFFCDSGQQAIITSLLVMEHNFLAAPHDATQTTRSGRLVKAHSDATVYIYDQCYYEVHAFFDKVKDMLTTRRERAKILFIDVISLSKMNIKAEADLQSFPQLKAVVIDMTNKPSIENLILSQTITALLQKGIWVVLATSTIKYEQLFADRYQSGRIQILRPSGVNLSKPMHDELTSISTAAMQPATAAYLQMVNEICGDKLPQTKTCIEPERLQVKPATTTDIYRGDSKPRRRNTLFQPAPPIARSQLPLDGKRKMATSTKTILQK